MKAGFAWEAKSRGVCVCVHTHIHTQQTPTKNIVPLTCFFLPTNFSRIPLRTIHNPNFPTLLLQRIPKRPSEPDNYKGKISKSVSVNGVAWSLWGKGRGEEYTGGSFDKL